MRLLVAAAVALIALVQPAFSATYYVTTTGSDVADGTSLGTAFATWQRGADAAVAGDTVLVSPGTYTVPAAGSYGFWVEHDGTSGSRITFRGNGGRPVLDCSAKTAINTCFVLDGANYWTISDIAVTGANQWNTSARGGIGFVNASNNILERAESYDNEGSGVIVWGASSNNILTNVDVHHNYDPDSTVPGGDSDGFELGAITGTGNQVINCRAWWNSDDGYDLWDTEAPVTITGSWSFWNGYIPGTFTAAGDGNGIKLGTNTTGPTHVITKSLTFENRHAGFDNNTGVGSPQIYANTAYANVYQNFVFDNGSGMTHDLRNNLSYGATVGGFGAGVTQTNNSWQLGLTLTDGDFSSVDSTGVDGARQADGSLPNLPFMRPLSCDIINRSPASLACCGKTLGALGRYVDPPVGFRRALPSAAILGTPTE